MTEQEADAAAMQMVRKYAETKRRIACLRNQLFEQSRAVENLFTAIGISQHGDDYSAPKIACQAVMWQEIARAAMMLSEEGEERKRLESALGEAGLADLAPGGG